MSIYNKNNLLVADMADKDGSRPEISGVLFKKDRTVATNSFTLIEVKNPVQFQKTITEIPELPDKSKPLLNFNKKGYILPVDAVKKILSNIPSNSSLPILENCCFTQPKHLESSNVVTTDLDRANNVTAKNIKGNYPNYQQIIPNEGGSKVVLNIKYLKKVINILSKMDLKNEKLGTIKLFINGEFEPVMIKATTKQDQKVTALIMPIRE